MSFRHYLWTEVQQYWQTYWQLSLDLACRPKCQCSERWLQTSGFLWPLPSDTAKPGQRLPDTCLVPDGLWSLSPATTSLLLLLLLYPHSRWTAIRMFIFVSMLSSSLLFTWSRILQQKLSWKEITCYDHVSDVICCITTDISIIVVILLWLIFVNDDESENSVFASCCCYDCCWFLFCWKCLCAGLCSLDSHIVRFCLFS